MMMMMKRETVARWAREARKMDHHASRDREMQLADSHLEALAEIDRLTAALADAGCACCTSYAEEIERSLLVVDPNGQEG
jgi:hypothetical protein